MSFRLLCERRILFKFNFVPSARIWRYENKDRGAHYHKSTGSVIKVRGRYGSRSPVDGRIDEVVYTAGARG